MLSVEVYAPQCRPRWDAFVCDSPCASFMHQRAFVEYHGSRFSDFSLMIGSNGKLLAILPAHLEAGGTLVSHRGLGYAGFLFAPGVKTRTAVAIFKKALQFLHNQGINGLLLRQVPSYQQQAGRDLSYLPLSWIQARLQFPEVSSVVLPHTSPRWQLRRRRALKKARKTGVVVQTEHTWPACWHLLEQNLWQRHQKRPVHSLHEIELLARTFPQNICLYTARRQEALLGCMVIFKTTAAWHAQYIASNEAGRHTGALEAIVAHLLALKPAGRGFSLGVSTLREQNAVNTGLLDWKEGFGAEPVPHNTWLVETGNFHMLQNRFL